MSKTVAISEDDCLKGVKTQVRKLLKYQDKQNFFEGLISVTELCALCLGKNIKIAVVQE